MKKIFLLAAVSACIISCNRLADNEYEITGTVDKALNGKQIILEKQGGYMGFIPVDTAVVKDGKFEFRGTVTEPSMHFLTLDDPMKKVDFILENGSINLKIDKDSLQKTERSGTPSNDKMAEYYKTIAAHTKKMMDFQKKNQAAYMDAFKKKDSVTMNNLQKQYSAITDEMAKASVNFVKDNPDSYISVLLLKQMSTSGKVEEKDIKGRFDALSAKMKKTKEGKELYESLYGGANVGRQAPDFSAPAPDGQTVSLKSALGKVTIIDFWASWCKPCRMENPNVVALYNEFHPKGLNIIGVSLDKDGKAWKDAIAADKLAWFQVSNLKFWDDPVAIKYGVKSIPATFILDASGKVVAKDLRGAALKAKVAELLNK
ncbi:hypothetical protein CHU92_05345 [Flavobacterium cyanobacteriorum]|uniref:Thioredoxin domain-containing protein n=1 Tax=Flavobacterium cyanobacteriorum TaxID=2022802 RepID=A0A255ZAD0_9FLAO|nr:TlpA disulfide reductase family protein [Flavobacterium cyanobacteriorum]OYQ38371.1 hypothetical protein CHU92_05345 [Flavobacterium cyanobacteriorum]